MSFYEFAFDEKWLQKFRVSDKLLLWKRRDNNTSQFSSVIFQHESFKDLIQWTNEKHLGYELWLML